MAMPRSNSSSTTIPGRPRQRWLAASCGLLLAMAGSAVQAFPHHHHEQVIESPAKADRDADSQNCFNPADPTELRLWPGQAPGAIGNDACRDIPYLKVYRAQGDASSARTAIIVMPGGGYDHLSDRKEQEPVARYFAEKLHVTTFVLFYRLVQSDGTYRYPIPMWDGQRALKLVRYRAAEFGIDPERIGLFGFSAGGHLATTLTEHSGTDFGLPVRDTIDEAKAKPAFLGLGYPVISMLPDQFASPNSLGHLLKDYQGAELNHLELYLSGQENVAERMPPVFLFESMDDARISPQNSVLMARALQARQVPAEVHLFPHGEHGAGLAEGISGEEQWPEMFRHWLNQLGYIR